MKPDGYMPDGTPVEIKVTGMMYDGFLPDGTPVELICALGNGKSMLQLEIYRKLFGIPDDEWEEIQQEAKRRLYGFQDEDSQD